MRFKRYLTVKDHFGGYNHLGRRHAERAMMQKDLSTVDPFES